MAHLLWIPPSSLGNTPAPLLRAAARGALTAFVGLAGACVVSIHDGDGQAQQAACFDSYEDCMDDAEHGDDVELCGDHLDSCLEACERGDESGDDGWGGSERGDWGDEDDPGDGDTTTGGPRLRE